MKEQAITEQVIIVLTEHPTFGMLLTPYCAEKFDDGTWQLMEQAFHASPEAICRMSEIERQAIDIASHYTDKYLMGVYSHEKTVARFLRKLSDNPEQVKNNIRPFIEKKLQEMLTLIRYHGLPLYQKQAGSKQLYAHHAYRVHPHDVEIHFTFLADAANFHYQLQCYYDGQPLSLSEHKPVLVLTSSPATLLLGMELYFFPHIESARILPFTKKKMISVPAVQVEKYVDNIVIPIARYHDITTQGLDFTEETYTCEALLSLEDTVYGEQMLQLGFRYGEQVFTPDTMVEMKKIIYRKGSDKIFFFRRDITAEEEKIRILTDSGLQQASDVLFRLSPDAPEKVVTEWISKHREMLKQSFQLTGNMGKTPFCLDEIHVEQSCDNEPDWFELHITVVIGNLRIPFSRFRKHILEEKREFLLPDGRIIILPEEWFSKYGDLLELGTPTETGIRLKPTLIGAAQAALEESNSKGLSLKKSIRNIAVPKGLNAQLRPYQKKGFSWMVQLNKQEFGGCLADDMGLGKTLQTLTLLQYIYKPQEPGKHTRRPATLIVVPTSLLHNWRREAERFTLLSIGEYNSNTAFPKGRPEAFFKRFHLIFTTYGMMRNNIDILRTHTFEYVVLDESQNIKNNESLTFRAVIQLRCNHRLALTGTPIENSLKDLWTQFRFLQPDLLGEESTFQKQFIVPIRQGNARMQKRLQQLIAPFILRRSKSEVAPELPSLTEETIYCDMPEEQEERYKQEKNSLRNILLRQPESKDRFHTFNILNGILRLRLLACHPQLIFPEFDGISGKMEQIIETFDTLQSEGHKVLIFSSFVKHLEILAEIFRERGWKYALLTGTTNDRPSEIAHFTEQNDVQAFLISLKAGGVGLNLTQADYVFIIDPWWNPAAEAQAIARAHRIGQDKQVIAYRFITQNSIEEKILQLQEDKRKLAETFITDSDALPALSNEQWVDLLK